MRSVAFGLRIVARAGEPKRVARFKGRTGHGSWCFLGRDHANYGTALGQAVLRDAARNPWQRWGVPLRWRVAGTDGWHGPAPRAEQARGERSVAAGAGKGALHRFRWIMAWRAVHLSPAGIAERRRLSRSVDRGPEHPDSGDAGAAAGGKCGRADQFSTVRPQAPRHSSLAAARGPEGPAGHAVADHHRAEHPRRLRAVHADDPPHAHRHVFLRRGGGGDPGHELKSQPDGCR